MIRQIIYGNTVIGYTVHFSNRKTLGITVMPNGSVGGNAPIDTSITQIEAKLYKRAAWILKQQDYFRSFGVCKHIKRYVSGESHYYLGRQYLLHVERSKPNSVRYKGRYFEIVCTPLSKAEDLMKMWYRERAKVKFVEIAEPIMRRFETLGYSPSSIYIQEMNGRWGSCTPKGKIILNTELIKAPVPCIEYVITHELCHLIHPNHTKAFFDLLTREMPDWQRWKDKLERFMK